MARNIHIANDVPDELNKKVKLEAIGDGYEGCTVVSQEVTKCIDRNYRSYLSIMTTYVDDIGATLLKIMSTI